MNKDNAIRLVDEISKVHRRLLALCDELDVEFGKRGFSYKRILACGDPLFLTQQEQVEYVLNEHVRSTFAVNQALAKLTDEDRKALGLNNQKFL